MDYLELEDSQGTIMMEDTNRVHSNRAWSGD
jgi:hypothetical protein